MGSDLICGLRTHDPNSTYLLGAMLSYRMLVTLCVYIVTLPATEIVNPPAAMTLGLNFEASTAVL